MKWHSLYQSVSHSVTSVVPECRLPLRPAPLHTTMVLPLGNSHSSPSCLSGPFRSFTSFYLNFTSCPFSVYYFLTYQLWPLENWGKEGSMLRGVEMFYPSWHPWQSVTSHFALSFVLFSPSAFSLQLPSSASLQKAPIPTIPVFFLLVGPCMLFTSRVSRCSCEVAEPV